MRLKLQQRRSNYYLYLQRMASKPGFHESLGIVLSLVTVSFFLIFALRPSLTKIAALKKEIETSEKTLNRLKKKSAALVKVEQIWSEVANESQRIEKTIPLGPDYSYFIKEIEWIAQKNQVNYVNGTFAASLIKSSLIDPYKLNQKLSPIEIKVSLRFEGDYPELLKTLDELMTLDRILAMDNVTINQNDKKDKRGRLVMTISGRVYYFGNKAEIDKLLQKIKKK